MEKIEVALTDGSWLEGKLDIASGNAGWDDVGVWLEDVHRGKGEGDVPIAKRVFVPYSAILFVVVEE